MTHESNDASEGSTKQRLSPVDKLILVLCVVGVGMMTYLVFEASGLRLFDAHMVDVLRDSWTTTATIGLTVALVVAVVVGVFIWMLAKATVSNPADDEIEAEYTEDLAPH